MHQTVSLTFEIKLEKISVGILNKNSNFLAENTEKYNEV